MKYSSSKYDKYYKRKVLASSVIFIRPLTPDESSTGYDYKVLLMKRHPKISFGGYYAFAGGKIEEQDLYENWNEHYPEMFNCFKRRYVDFTARICAIRETFEETNILIHRRIDECDTNGEVKKKFSRDLYLAKYKSNFLEFCKDHIIIPDLS